ncbi:MAG: flavin reductase family protein [Solirubrobacteraceae bacterium]
MSSIDEDFARLAGQLDYSLFIVTAAHGNERDGCLIGFATQVSIDPSRFLACLSVKNRTYRLAAQAATLVVHPVPDDAEHLAVLFGGETGDEVDKFAQCRWEPGPSGIPVLSDIDNWFAGRVLGHVGFGDHVGFVLEPTVVHKSGALDTLTFRRGQAIEPGHAP